MRKYGIFVVFASLIIAAVTIIGLLLGIDRELWICFSRLLSALTAIIGGAFYMKKRKKVLLFKILFGGLCCFGLGCVFTLTAAWVGFSLPSGFSIADISFAGLYIFLFSADYGALDSLADDGSAETQKYRLASLAAPIISALISAILIALGGSTARLIIWGISLLPVSYFTLKHLLLPDIKAGFVRALRTYNAATAAIILTDIAAKTLGVLVSREWELFLSAAVGLMLIALFPLANKGVDKWYM